MTPRFRQGLQEGLLDRIKREHPGTTDSEIAGVASVDRSLVSRWRSGEREIGLSELLQLQRRYGAVTVLGSIAALDRCEVRTLEANAVPLRRGAIAVVQVASDLAGSLEDALEDGRLSQEEQTQLSDAATALAGSLEKLRASIILGKTT